MLYIVLNITYQNTASPFCKVLGFPVHVILNSYIIVGILKKTTSIIKSPCCRPALSAAPPTSTFPTYWRAGTCGLGLNALMLTAIVGSKQGVRNNLETRH